jgi:hypothetical protein
VTKLSTLIFDFFFRLSQARGVRPTARNSLEPSQGTPVVKNKVSIFWFQAVANPWGAPDSPEQPGAITGYPSCENIFSRFLDFRLSQAWGVRPTARSSLEPSQGNPVVKNKFSIFWFQAVASPWGAPDSPEQPGAITGYPSCELFFWRFFFQAVASLWGAPGSLEQPGAITG